MKNLIFALVALVSVISFSNASEMQDVWCDDKSLSYCINHYDRQCESKNYGACFGVGSLYLKQGQYYESQKYYKLVCDKANSKDAVWLIWIDGLTSKVPNVEVMKMACYSLARFYYNGLGVRQDYSKALQYNKRACDLGNAKSCGLAGFQYFLGEGIKKDLKLAKSYLEKSCEMQSGFGALG